MVAARSLVKQNPLTAFLVITLFIGFAASVGIWLSPDRVAMTLTFGLLIAFSSTIAALIVLAVLHDPEENQALRHRLLHWRVGLRWYLIALGVPTLAWLLASIVSLLSGATIVPAWANLAQVPAIVLLVIGEEFGWRGFALPHFQQRYSPRTASLVIGFFWGLYHVTAYLQQSLIIIILTFALAIIGSVILTWLFNGTSGSIPVGVVFHTAVNTGSLILLAGNSRIEATFLAAVLILGVFAGFLCVRPSFLSVKGVQLVPAKP